MPYIPQENRIIIDDKIKNIIDHVCLEDIKIGEINYIITTLLNAYITQKHEKSQFNYDVCNNLIGVLECAKQELYRRVIVGYENFKIEQNGDVYENIEH